MNGALEAASVEFSALGPHGATPGGEVQREPGREMHRATGKPLGRVGP